MRKFLAITIMVIMAGTASAQEGVTFVVDENLAPIEKKYPMESYLSSGDKAIRGIFSDEGVPGDTHATIAWSFADDEKFYTLKGKGRASSAGALARHDVGARQSGLRPLCQCPL